MRLSGNKARGFVSVSGPDGTEENETFTCKHCTALVDVPFKGNPEDIGGMCRHCHAMVCKACCAVGRCTPFEKQIEIALRRNRMLEQAGIG